MAMDAPGSDGQDSLFFHLQRTPVRHYRRVRKEPEELPQALRYFKYANLNPRIAAFLGKQDPKNILKRSKGGKTDGKEGAASAPSGGLIAGEYGNDLSQEARRLLPEIGQNMSYMNPYGDDSFGQSRLSFTNDIDDPQRYQFEETTFAAPNILRELADTLTRFNTSFKEYVNRTTLYDPDTGDPLTSENTNPSVLLPAGVTNLLCIDWDNAVAETIYTPRAWQTTAYKAAYNFSQMAGAPLQSPNQKENSPQTADKPTTASGALKPELKGMADLLDEVKTKPQSKRDGDPESRVSVDTKKKSKSVSKEISLHALALPELKNSLRDKSQDRKGPLKEPSNSVLKNKSKRPQKRSPVGNQASKAQFSRLIGEEKKNSSVAGLPKGKDWALRSNASILGGQDNYHDKVPRGNQTLSFNLSSKKALDEGWIVKTQPDADMEQDNVLEWATGRLQSAIKQKEEEDESAKKTGCNKPVVIRYYGDSRRDTLLKLYRKGNETDGKAAAVAAGLLPGRKATGGLKIPQLSKMENTTKDRFMVQVADGSTTVYYPKTGEVAFMASAVPEHPGQLYTNIFANDENRTCLASFTPYGKSCCYHKNGAPGLILTDQGGLLKNEDGSVLKRWEWPRPGLKLKENVVFHLNKEMYVRVANRNSVTLHFTANRETMKMNVGALPGLDGPSAMPDQGNVLRSGYKYSSKAASEFQQSYRKEEKVHRGGKRGKQAMRKPVVQSRKSIEVEELKQSLDPPERFQFESQADRELRRLQDRSKHVVDEWMEHYRISVGLSSPALKKMLDQPVIKGAHRKVQSARERKEGDRDESEERITKFQSFRSPSAPPRHMVPGPHAIMVKEDKHRKGGTSSVAGMTSRKSHDAHVRIDDTPSVVVESPSKEVISPQRSTQGSRQRPATQGSRTLHRPQRSSMRTSSSAGSGPGKVTEKTWSPAPECCPVVTRNTLLYDDTKHPDKQFTCKCSKHRIPHIHDLELDYYLRMVAPVSQLVVVCVVNTLYPQASPYDTMFDKLYVDRNKNRSKPCSQSRHDQYRILRYDLAVAKLGSNRPAPLLLGRHNVVPGMTLMYCGGRLLFADHIFNGYGNARNDFRKQVFRTKREFLLGHFLPDDFRFTPGRGKSGARAAWGGQMGGAGVDGKGSPGLFFNNPGVKAKSADFNPPVQAGADETRSLGDVTSDSTMDLKMQTSKSFDTARDFVQFTLSTKMYVIPPSTNHKRSRTRIDHRSHSTATSRYAAHNSSFPPAGATPHSSVNDDGSLRQLSSFSRLQAVK